MKRKLLRAAVAFAFTLVAPIAFAQWSPTKPVRIVVPFPAGGIVDLMSRSFTDKLSAALGQPVVIERGGGPGRSGRAHTADGHAVDGHPATVHEDDLAPDQGLRRRGDGRSGAQPGRDARHARAQDAARVHRLREGPARAAELRQWRQWHLADAGGGTAAQEHRHAADVGGLQRLPTGHPGHDRRADRIFDGALRGRGAPCEVGQAAPTSR